MRYRTLHEAFFRHIDVEDIEEDSAERCWIWRGARTAFGHGRLGFRGRSYLAHRLAYMWKHGEIPENMFVCHTCDVPLCVNPHHLVLGTPADNARDTVVRGRRNRELTGQAKLIRQARHRHSLTQKAVANAMGVQPAEVGYWENQMRVPPEFMHKLARILKMNPKELFIDQLESLEMYEKFNLNKS